MSYQDEEILKAKKAIADEKERLEQKENLEKEAEKSIYDGTVTILGKEVLFQRREITELNISIYMPESFFLLAPDLARLIYPAGNAPSHVFGGEDIQFQMTMNQTTHAVPNDGMKEFVKISAQLLEAMGPKVTIVEKKVEEKENFNIGILQFVSRAVDMMVYNIQYYVSMNGKLLMGTVTFPSKYKKRMIPLAKEIIGSIEIMKEGGDGNNYTS